MPYILTPHWARILQRTLFAARYLLLGLAGVVAVVNPNPNLDPVGWLLIIGAWIAVAGVTTGRFHFELVAIWFLLGALTWATGILIAEGRPISAILLVALVPALGERLLHLMLVASRARRTPHDEDARHGDK